MDHRKSYVLLNEKNGHIREPGNIMDLLVMYLVFKVTRLYKFILYKQKTSKIPPTKITNRKCLLGMQNLKLNALGPYLIALFY